MSAVSNPYIFNIKNNYSSKAEINIAFISQSWTSPGTYTWTAPFTGTVTACVIGGGGGGSDTSDASTNGSSSSFASIVANGGGRGYVSYNDSTEMHAGSGGSPNGRSGTTDRGSGVINGGTGFNLAKTLTNGSYGSGGAVRGQNLFAFKASGGSGGCNIQQVSVIKGQSYQVVVGSGGRGTNPNDSYYAKNGNKGAVGIWKE